MMYFFFFLPLYVILSLGNIWWWGTGATLMLSGHLSETFCSIIVFFLNQYHLRLSDNICVITVRYLLLALVSCTV